mmetsp:Transcript_116631/g.326261  ORF Transcript_116631/g.326261 Transcript_116631/m.326261 type:complete len:175 (+) Transcript_116631:76-600(+)
MSGEVQEIDPESVLTPQQIAEYKFVFDMHGEEDHGSKEKTINTNQLGTVMRILGVNPTEEELKQWIQEADKDCSGTLDFKEEFLPLMARKLTDIDDEAELCAAFEPFDHEGCGLISCKEFRHIMTILGQRSSAKQIDRMIQLVGADDAGMIDYRAFVHTILNEFSMMELRAELG